MQYELAKQLKDAGWSQKIYPGATFYPYPESNERVWTEDTNPTPIEGATITPTLSELIEACGDIDFSLNKVKDYSPQKRWVADDDSLDLKDGEHTCEGFGITPEEAVAKLYLLLHAQEKL